MGFDIKEKIEELKTIAVKAIMRVLVDKLELRELWKENKSDYDSWKNDKLDIQKRLMQ